MEPAVRASIERERLRRLFFRSLQLKSAPDQREAHVESLIAAEEQLRRDLGTNETFADTACDGVREAKPPVIRSAETWLSDSEVKEAEALRWMARLYGVSSLLDAFRWYLAHAPAALAAPPVRTCADEFLIVKRCERIREKTLRFYGANIARFVAEFGDRQPCAILGRDIARFLARYDCAYTYVANRQPLMTFFRWMIQMGYAVDNPVAAGTKAPILRKPERFVLTIDEVRQLLRLAKHTDAVGCWILGLFAGVRTNEIADMQRLSDPWSVVRFDTKIIDLPASITKTGPRVVPVAPVLEAWLRWVKKNEFPFMPKNWAAKTKRVRDRVLSPRQLTRNRGNFDPRVINVARRTYISYRLAMPEVGFAEVSDEVGNSEEVMRKHYYRRVCRSDALKYFALTPDRV